MPTVLFGDVAEAVVAWLGAKLSPVPVYGRVPNPRPASFVVVSRTGGPRVGLVVEEAQITVDVWASTESAAHDLAQLARAWVWDMAGDQSTSVAVYRVRELGGPTWQPDGVTTTPRFTFTVWLDVRAVNV